MQKTYVSEYAKLLIQQYYTKPKAKSTIELFAKYFSVIYEMVSTFADKFDIEEAEGEQLDIIGKILGISRVVPHVIPKPFFGFTDNILATGFDCKFDVKESLNPFRDKFSSSYANLRLNDKDYRIFLKLKAAKNNTSGYLISKNNRIGIQEVIQYAFKGKAHVSDNKDMTLTIHINKDTLQMLENLKALDLFPRPEGVGYKYILQNDINNTFNFKQNPIAKGFGDKNDTNTNSGKFAKKVL